MVWRDLEPYEDPEVKFNRELFDRYVRLIAIHRRFAALQSGFSHTLLADDARNILVYSRDLGDAHVYVVVNRSGSGQSVDLELPDARTNPALIDWLDPAEAVVRSADLRNPAGRPEIQALPGAKPAVLPHNGDAHIALQPWETMILAPAGAN